MKETVLHEDGKPLHEDGKPLHEDGHQKNNPINEDFFKRRGEISQLKMFNPNL